MKILTDKKYTHSEAQAFADGTQHVIGRAGEKERVEKPFRYIYGVTGATLLAGELQDIINIVTADKDEISRH